MNAQKEIFLSTEGDEWYLRNKDAYANTKDKEDIIIESLRDLEIAPKKILEIGCSNGVRLNRLNKVFGSQCFGIEPSAQAVENGNKEFPNLNLQVGTADSLPYEDNAFDMIVFGFSLCLCDRNDLFRIAMEADRCLANDGLLVILDFYPPFPYKNPWKHREGMFVYKMDYSKMFSWNPGYQEIHNVVFTHGGFVNKNIPDEKLAMTILSKDSKYAYPIEPYNRIN